MLEEDLAEDRKGFSGPLSADSPLLEVVVDDWGNRASLQLAKHGPICNGEYQDLGPYEGARIPCREIRYWRRPSTQAIPIGQGSTAPSFQVERVPGEIIGYLSLRQSHVFACEQQFREADRHEYRLTGIPPPKFAFESRRPLYAQISAASLENAMTIEEHSKTFQNPHLVHTDSENDDMGEHRYVSLYLVPRLGPPPAHLVQRDIDDEFDPIASTLPWSCSVLDDETDWSGYDSDEDFQVLEDGEAEGNSNAESGYDSQPAKNAEVDDGEAEGSSKAESGHDSQPAKNAAVVPKDLTVPLTYCAWWTGE